MQEPTQKHTIIVFGGAGRTGIEVVRAALAAGHTVSAFVHKKPPSGVLPEHANLRIIVGDARNKEAVQTALASHDVVMNIIAPKFNDKRNYDISLVATKNIISGMEELGMTRYIGQAGAWATEFLEDASLIMRIAFKIIPQFRGIYTYKRQEDAVVKASSLNWTLVRCGLLTNRPLAPIKIAESRHTCAWYEIPKISRKSVAQFHLAILDEPQYSRRCPIIFN
jgi:putative NADH-flavin reductase